MARIWGCPSGKLPGAWFLLLARRGVRTRGSWPSIIGVELGTSWLPGRSDIWT